MKKKYGSLTIIEATEARKYGGYVVYKVKCDCGNIDYRTLNGLSDTSSCDTCKSKKQSDLMATHGMYAKNKRLARICKGAYNRCNNPKLKSYNDYGGRGIEFKFDSIQHMFDWSLENGYADDLSIDRIDNDGPYSPDNCRWTTLEVQANNKRDTLSLDGITGLNNIAEYLGITRGSLNNMLYKKKMTLEEIVNSTYLKEEDKKSVAQRSRTDKLVISKEEAIKIVENINNGSTINKEAKRLGKDHLTIKRAIKRLEDGYYK